MWRLWNSGIRTNLFIRLLAFIGSSWEPKSTLSSSRVKRLWTSKGLFPSITTEDFKIKHILEISHKIIHSMFLSTLQHSIEWKLLKNSAFKFQRRTQRRNVKGQKLAQVLSTTKALAAALLLKSSSGALRWGGHSYGEGIAHKTFKCQNSMWNLAGVIPGRTTWKIWTQIWHNLAKVPIRNE